MATVIRTEKRQRTGFGKLIKWVFIAFNVLMVIWLVSGMNAVSQMTIDSDAARAGQAIGATIGFSMVLGIWMMGAVILGPFVLLTRGDKVIVEETPAGSYADRSYGQQASASAADPDVMIAHYLQRRQMVPQERAPSPPPSQAHFGRRRDTIGG